jgi:hypothetical protein
MPVDLLLIPGPLMPQVQIFHFFSGPWGLSQKGQTRLDARVIVKTPDIDDSSHLIPTVMFHQLIKNHFQSDAVQRVIGLFVSHVLIMSV